MKIAEKNIKYPLRLSLFLLSGISIVILFLIWIFLIPIVGKWSINDPNLLFFGLTSIFSFFSILVGLVLIFGGLIFLKLKNYVYSKL